MRGFWLVRNTQYLDKYEQITHNNIVCYEERNLIFLCLT